MWKPRIAERWANWSRALRHSVTGLEGRRLVALALWLSVGGALWLQPVALHRRALEGRLDQLEQTMRNEERIHEKFAQIDRALHDDPTAIERLARYNGYGRPGESVYPLTDKELRAAAKLARDDRPADFDWTGSVGKALAPAVMILILGAVSVLFFMDLRVEDHLPASAPAPRPPEMPQ